MAVLKDLALKVNLSFDEDADLGFGLVSDYHVVLLSPQDKVYQLIYSVSKHGIVPELSELKTIVELSESLSKVAVNGHLVTFTIKYGMTKSKVAERIKQALNEIPTYFASNGFSNVCQVTGEPTTTLYQAGTTVAFLSESGLVKLKAEMGEKLIASENTPEQFVPGLIGALLGSILGVGLIVLLGQLGFVASVSGLVMGLAVVKGYELLGKKLTKKGILVSVLVMLAMTYFAFKLDWALSIAKLAETDVFTAFQSIPYLLKSGDLDTVSYYTEMAKLYLFALVGFVPTLIAAVSKAKAQFQLRQIL